MTTRGSSPDQLGRELLGAINRTYPRVPGVVLGRAWLAVAQTLAGAADRIAHIAYAFYGMTSTPTRGREVPAYVVVTDSELLILVAVTSSAEIPSLPETFELTEVPLSTVRLDVRRGLLLDRVTISYREPMARAPRQVVLRRVAHHPELAGLQALIDARRTHADIPRNDAS